MAPVSSVFKALRKLCRPGGHIFISVNNCSHERLEFKEKFLGGEYGMPPKYTGLWMQSCFAIAASRYGLELVETRVSPNKTWDALWHTAYSRVSSMVKQRKGPISGQLYKVRLRALRGTLKALVAVTSLPWLLLKLNQFHGAVLWAHLQVPE